MNIIARYGYVCGILIAIYFSLGRHIIGKISMTNVNVRLPNPVTLLIRRAKCVMYYTSIMITFRIRKFMNVSSIYEIVNCQLYCTTIMMRRVALGYIVRLVNAVTAAVGSR